MLNGKLVLHDVRDTECFAARIVQRSGLELSHHDREDLLAFLVETAWELSLDYRRGDPQYPPRFSVYATNILSRRVFDWKRKRSGRTVWVNPNGNTGTVYERPRPQLVPLDDRQDSIDYSSDLDAGASGLSDLLGLQRKGSSGLPRRVNGMGKAPSDIAA